MLLVMPNDLPTTTRRLPDLTATSAIDGLPMRLAAAAGSPTRGFPEAGERQPLLSAGVVNQASARRAQRRADPPLNRALAWLRVSLIPWRWGGPWAAQNRGPRAVTGERRHVTCAVEGFCCGRVGCNRHRLAPHCRPDGARIIRGFGSRMRNTINAVATTMRGGRVARKAESAGALPVATPRAHG